MAVLQTTVGPLVGILGVVPEGVLLVVVSWSMVRGSQRGMIWGLLGGLSIDLLSGAPLGTHTLALMLIGFVTGFLMRSPFESRLVLPILVIMVATVAYDVMTAAILRVTGWPLALGPAIRTVVIPSIVTNAILMPLIYWSVLWIVYQLDRVRGGLRPVI